MQHTSPIRLGARRAPRLSARISVALVLALLLGLISFVPEASAVPARRMRITKTEYGPTVGNKFMLGQWTVGSTGQFKIAVNNESNAATVALTPGTYTMTDALPAGFQVTAVSAPAPWQCQAPPATGTFSCSFTVNSQGVPVIDFDEALPDIILTVKVTAAPAAGNTYLNCASLDTQLLTAVNEFTKAYGNNPSCATVRVRNFQGPDLADICIRKYADDNANGLQDPREAALAGFRFSVKDARGVEKGPVVSAADPKCLTVPAGRYTVTETAQEGYTATSPRGGSTTVDVAARTISMLPFGNKPMSQLCVHKFSDVDNDGVQDAGEPLLDGFVFNIKKGTQASGQLVSGAGSGHDCLRVTPGTYTVTEVAQAGWTPTSPASGSMTVNVPANQSTLVTFGNHGSCCLEFQHSGGRKDTFSQADGPQAEPADAQVPGAISYFDSTKPDALFAHRFSLPTGNCISAASVEFMLRAIPYSDSDNDTLSLRVLPQARKTWTANLTALNGAPAWTSAQGAKGYVFDLAALPAAGVTGATNLIAALNTTRRLDLTMQDDTSIDYAILRVTYCECAAG